MKYVYVPLITAFLCLSVLGQAIRPDTIPLDQADQSLLETIFLELLSTGLKDIKATDELNLLARRLCKPGFDGLGKYPNCELTPLPKGKGKLAKYKRDLVRASLLIKELKATSDLYNSLIALLESQVKLWNARTTGDYKLDWKNKQFVRLSADEKPLTPHEAAIKYSGDFLTNLDAQARAALEQIKQKH